MTRRSARTCLLLAVGCLAVGLLPAVPAANAAAPGTISGRVTSASGGRSLDAVDIWALDGSDNVVAEGRSTPDGSYTVTGLAASTIGYAVCALGHYRVGDGSPAGYATVCYKNVLWNSDNGGPRGATTVPVATGATTSGIDIAQPELGGISGRVTGSVSGAGLSGIIVMADDGIHTPKETTTGTDGRYLLPTLDPSTTGDTVCFVGAPGREGAARRAKKVYGAVTSDAAVGTSEHHDNKCYKNVPYHVDALYPLDATTVQVRRGAVTAGIDGVLELQGGISGRVTTAAGIGIPGLSVTVFDSGGRVPFTLPLENYTGPDGSFLVDGLDPVSGYSVCFDGGTAYPSRCYRSALWGDQQLGPAPGSTPVTVRAGAITTGINSVWAAAGGISGQVTDAAGAGLSRVQVVVTEADGFTQSAYTTSTGRYLVTGLAASAGAGVCFVPETDAAAGGIVPRTGYASECYPTVPYRGGPSLPRGTTGVPVTPGHVTAGINAKLGLDGAISGSVTSAAGHSPLNARVTVYDSAGIGVGVTDASGGRYFLGGLAVSTTGYRVCVSTNDGPRPGGSSTTGYAPRCYRNSPYVTTGDGNPGAGSVAVPVRAGVISKGVDVELHTGGVISGTVTAANGGDKLFNAGVSVFDGAGVEVEQGQTDEAGRYSISGLAASMTGYTLCFDATVFAGNPSPTGYQRKCYRNTPWTGGSTATLGATRVPVTFGQTVAGIDVALADAGIMSGTVSAATTGSRVAGVDVVLFDKAKHRIASTVTAGDGRYTFVGLAPSAAGYAVCFDSSAAADHYLGVCYRNVAWSPSCPPPPGTMPVPVAVGTPSVGINVKLRK